MAVVVAVVRRVTKWVGGEDEGELLVALMPERVEMPLAGMLDCESSVEGVVSGSDCAS